MSFLEATVAILGLMSVWVVVWIVLQYISAILHELGHYSVAKALGAEVTSCGFGYRWRFLEFRGGRTTFFLGARQLTGHTAFELPPRLRQNWRFLLIVAAGPAVNVALLAMGSVTYPLVARSSPEVWNPAVRSLVLMLIWTNWLAQGLLLLMNLWPHQFPNGVLSDGMLALHLLRAHPVRGTCLGALTALKRSPVEGFAAVEPALVRPSLLKGAWEWSTLGNFPRAIRSLEAAKELACTKTSDAESLWHEGQTLMQVGRFDEGEPFIEQALVEYNRERQTWTIKAAQWRELTQLCHLEATVTGLHRLEELAVEGGGSPTPEAWDWPIKQVRFYLLARLYRRQESEVAYDAVSNHAHFASLGVDRLKMLRLLGRVRWADGDLPAAADAYQRAVQMLRGYKNSLAAREDREELLLSQEDLRMEVTCVLSRLGRQRAIATVDRVFDPRRG